MSNRITRRGRKEGGKKPALTFQVRDNRAVISPQGHDIQINRILFNQLEKMGRAGFTFLKPFDMTADLEIASDLQIESFKTRKGVIFFGKKEPLK